MNKITLKKVSKFFADIKMCRSKNKLIQLAWISANFLVAFNAFTLLHFLKKTYCTPPPLLNMKKLKQASVSGIAH